MIFDIADPSTSTKSWSQKRIQSLQSPLNDVTVYFCNLTLCGFTDAGTDVDSLSCRNSAFFFNYSSFSC